MDFLTVAILTSVALLYTNNKLSEREIRETIPFITESKRIKYLEVAPWWLRW